MIDFGDCLSDTFIEYAFADFPDPYWGDNNQTNNDTNQTKTNFTIQMWDSAGNGWSNNRIVVKQDGESDIEFGSGFSSGSSFSSDFQLVRGKEAIVSAEISNSSNSK